METHILKARTRKGRTIEIGHVNSLEQAARLEKALEDCLGEGFASFETVELEPVPPTVSSLDFYAELERIMRRSN